MTAEASGLGAAPGEPAILRDWSPGDGDWYVAQLPDTAIQRFTTERVGTTADDFRAAVEELGRRDDQAGFAITDAGTGRLAGNMAATRSGDTAEVSYWVAPGFRGRGLASSAVRSLVAWIDANWQVHAIALWAHKDNIASQRTAEHAGFRHQPDRDELRSVGSQVWPVRCYQRGPSGPLCGRPQPPGPLRRLSSRKPGE